MQEGCKVLTAERDFSPKQTAGRGKPRRFDDNGLGRSIRSIVGCQAIGAQACDRAGIGYTIKNGAKVADNYRAIWNHFISQRIKHLPFSGVNMTIGGKAEIITGLPGIDRGSFIQRFLL